MLEISARAQQKIVIILSFFLCSSNYISGSCCGRPAGFGGPSQFFLSVFSLLSFLAFPFSDFLQSLLFVCVYDATKRSKKIN